MSCKIAYKVLILFNKRARPSIFTFTFLLYGVLIGFIVTYLCIPRTSQESVSKRQSLANVCVHSCVMPTEEVQHTGYYRNRSQRVQPFKDLRVLCWMLLIHGKDHAKQAQHARDTWGQHCDRLIFVKSYTNSKAEYWKNTRDFLVNIHRQYGTGVDWFFQADVDTFTVLENLRHMLYVYDTDTPIYFDWKYRAGYVLSREALRRVAFAISNTTICEENESYEDSLKQIIEQRKDQLVTCLVKVNVAVANECGSLVGTKHWNNVISLYNVSLNQMYVLDYLIYRVKPYGVHQL